VVASQWRYACAMTGGPVAANYPHWLILIERGGSG
jgi:hypothetical protein